MADLTFEAALKKLEKIAHQLEEGMTLEASLKAFEDGVGLYQYCAGKLEQAEQKVQMLLVDEDGKVHLEPFAGENREEDEV